MVLVYILRIWSILVWIGDGVLGVVVEYRDSIYICGKNYLV